MSLKVFRDLIVEAAVNHMAVEDFDIISTGYSEEDNTLALGDFCIDRDKSLIELIDYVLYHELTHTKILHHGPNFWLELERHVPQAKRLRKVIRGYHPVIST